jgi:2,4-dienoyl-CoA reductase-like NADH-dependent reductase (Old Yellow Enzyme family)
MMTRFEQAAPSRFEREVVRAGYVVGGRGAPFEPVWNRSRFEAVKRLVSVPVLAVGGIRTKDEVVSILDAGAADMVGIGRPFYAEPDLAHRILDPERSLDAPGLCVNSNRCVAAQMLGMKGACYNPDVVKLRRSTRA